MVSDFDSKVYAAVRLIPRGMVSTYAHIAAAVGCASPRAVGQALKRNPFAPDVPCHRVIRADLRIGGFCGKSNGTEIERKTALLEKEGVLFRNGMLADRATLFTGLTRISRRK